MHILSLKSKTSKMEATNLFRGQKLSRWLRSQRRGQLVDVRQVHIPYWLFHVTISNRGQEQRSWLAMDAVTGQLDLHRFEASLTDTDLVRVQSDSVLPVQLLSEDLRGLLMERVRRQVYLGGFFRLSDLQLEAECIDRPFYIPYWIGFYRRGDQTSVDVIDAVRGQLEGAKVRDIISEFLSSTCVA